MNPITKIMSENCNKDEIQELKEKIEYLTKQNMHLVAENEYYIRENEIQHKELRRLEDLAGEVDVLGNNRVKELENDLSYANYCLREVMDENFNFKTILCEKLIEKLFLKKGERI